jgi:hypothetical protein
LIVKRRHPDVFWGNGVLQRGATMVVSRFAKKEDFNNIVIGFNKNNKKTNSDLSKALNISKEFLFSSSDDLTINII